MKNNTLGIKLRGFPMYQKLHYVNFVYEDPVKRVIEFTINNPIDKGEKKIVIPKEQIEDITEYTGGLI